MHASLHFELLNLLAIRGRVVLRLGFGRVLQLVHARAWQLTLPTKQADQASYGVVLAIYFWIAFSSASIVWAASLSPALAGRRNLRRLLAES